MNKKYRKQMRLKSRHHRRGHSFQFCKCPELWQNIMLALERHVRLNGPLKVKRRVRRSREEPASQCTDGNSPACHSRP